MQNRYPNSYSPQPPQRNLIIVVIVVCALVVCSPFIIGSLVTGFLSTVHLPCGVGGCHIPTPTSTGPTPDPRLFQTVDIGTELTYNGKRLLVSSVTQANSYGEVTAEDGYQLVAVDISFTELSNSQLDMSTGDFDVTDGAGHIYNRIKDAKAPALSSQTDSTPSSATGWLTFQVPAKANDLMLQYSMTSVRGIPVVLQIRLGDLTGHITVILRWLPNRSNNTIFAVIT